MPSLVAFLAGYALGAVPVAWLLVRWRHGFALHAAGSTNIGATNAYETTGSKKTGLAVLVLDLLKGALAVLTGWTVHYLLGAAPSFAEATRLFWPGAAALLGALLGHNYNLFLSLKAGKLAGGKGFATAAGGFLLLIPLAVLTWLVLLWVGIRAFERWKGVRDLIPGNLFATTLAIPFAWAVYGPDAAGAVAAFAALTVPKHIRQMGALLRTPYGVDPFEATPARAVGGARRSEPGPQESVNADESR